MDTKQSKSRNPDQPTKEREPSVTAVTRLEASFMGPLPPPAILAKYNDALPNGAERIMAMAEKQSVHREALEMAIIKANIKSQTRGAYFGFIVAMTAILGGIYLITIGKSASGLSAIVTSLVALATVFIFGKARQREELNQKATPLNERTTQNR